MHSSPMPFGRHKGAPLSTIGTSYLCWLLREAKLSSALRMAVGNELRSRNVEAPDPRPYKIPPCRRCGARECRAMWQQVGDGSRRLRGVCGRCGGFVRFLPLAEPFLSVANAAESAVTADEALRRLQAAGLRIGSDGRSAWFQFDDWRNATLEQQALLHQHAHGIAALLGRTVPAYACGED